MKLVNEAAVFLNWLEVLHGQHSQARACAKTWASMFSSCLTEKNKSKSELKDWTQIFAYQPCLVLMKSHTPKMVDYT